MERHGDFRPVVESTKRIQRDKKTKTKTKRGWVKNQDGRRRKVGSSLVCSTGETWMIELVGA